jgi:GNAT superfamily N-acetyltransferase
MSSIQVRRFVRADRDQVTDLVNAHIAAVVPNVAVSVSGLLSQLEREPGEFIVDPWVAERITLVAEQRQRVVAAAHLLRLAADERVAESYRGAGEIHWLVCWPEAPYWPDSTEAGDALAEACTAQLRLWAVSRCYADGALPAPGVYGVPEQWPHIRAAYYRAGFRPDGRTETVFLARIEDLPRPGEQPMAGLVQSRSLGINGTRISAVRNQQEIGYIEVSSRDSSPRTQRAQGWADVGNLKVGEAHRRTGVGTWLLAQAADWLELGGVTRLLGYAEATDTAFPGFFSRCGFRILTRTIRPLTMPGSGDAVDRPVTG